MEHINIKPRKFLLIPTGTYNQQYHRPYRTDVSDYLINALYEKTKGGADTSVSAVSGVAGNILTPSNKPVEMANIKHGWGTKRYRFVLILDVTTGGKLYTQVATGYTDYIRASKINGNKANIDPDMEIYFNSFQTFTSKTQMTPNGVKTMLIPYDISQLIRTESRTSMGQFKYEHMNPALEQQLLRPQDVFNKLTLNMIAFGNDFVPSEDGEEPSYNVLLDARSSSTEQLTTSNRKNANSTNYLSSLLTGIKDSKDAYGDTNTCNIYAEASNNKHLVDQPISSNGTLYKISSCYSDFSKRGYLKMKELKVIIPDLDYVTQVIGLSQVKKVRMPHEEGQSESLSNIGREAHAATILANALPDLMIDSMLGQINFTASNNYADGLIRFTWTDNDSAKSIVKGIEAYINKFVHRLTNEVLYDLCHQGAVRFNLHVFADLTDDIRISIGFDGGLEEPYVLPIFSDSIFSPVIGNSGKDLSDLSNNMKSLMHNIVGDI